MYVHVLEELAEHSWPHPVVFFQKWEVSIDLDR